MLGDILTLAVCFLVLLIILPSLINPVTYAPPIPSGKNHRNWMLSRLSSLQGVKVVEVGSGWGGLSLSAAKLDSVSTVTAIELSPVLAIICWVRFQLSPQRKKLSIIWADALSPKGIATMNAADALLLYTFKEFNDKLTMLRPGLVVLSSCFQVPGLKLIKSRVVGWGTVFEYQVLP